MIHDLLYQAFPRQLAPAVASALACLEEPSFASHHTFVVRVVDDMLAIPYRIYYDTQHFTTCDHLPPIQRAVLLCWFTRHHNGFIREHCLHEIIALPYPWIAPYVLQLLGEYVLEIITFIHTSIPIFSRPVYTAFLTTNRPFWMLTQQRVASYWNCYYRWHYPNKATYVGFQAVQRLNQFVRSADHI